LRCGAAADDQHHDLGGLALAVGILVDEATVAIENIHTHLARGTPIARAVLDASGEVVVPRFLAMASVVAVFVPSFFMTGVSRSLFVPLSLAVGFAMIASFLLSSSLVPVLSVWWLARHRTAPQMNRSPAIGWIACATVCRGRWSASRPRAPCWWRRTCS
jgi:multidrug efflux pump subunit AcrB